MVMLSVALFLEVEFALFLGPWLGVLRIGAGGWTGAIGAGICGAEGAGWITVVRLEVWQQHLRKGSLPRVGRLRLRSLQPVRWKSSGSLVFRPGLVDRVGPISPTELWRAVVPVVESLHCLVYGILVLIVEQVCDFSGPIHGLDGNLDRFWFVGWYDMIHGPHVASGFDLDCVARLNLHGRYVIGRWANLIGADQPNWVDGPSVFRELENFLPGFSNLESAVILDRMGVGHVQCT